MWLIITKETLMKRGKKNPVKTQKITLNDTKLFPSDSGIVCLGFCKKR